MFRTLFSNSSCPHNIYLQLHSQFLTPLGSLTTFDLSLEVMRTFGTNSHLKYVASSSLSSSCITCSSTNYIIIQDIKFPMCAMFIHFVFTKLTNYDVIVWLSVFKKQHCMNLQIEQCNDLTNYHKVNMAATKREPSSILFSFNCFSAWKISFKGPPECVVVKGLHVLVKQSKTASFVVLPRHLVVLQWCHRQHECCQQFLEFAQAVAVSKTQGTLLDY